jgi:transcriptional regulator with XRE-family HTH domain
VYLNLKLQIFRSGIRQNRLAQILGMDEALLSKIVNGYRLPKPEIRSQIAKILQHDEEWLFATTGRADPRASENDAASESKPAGGDGND